MLQRPLTESCPECPHMVIFTDDGGKSHRRAYWEMTKYRRGKPAGTDESEPNDPHFIHGIPLQPIQPSLSTNQRSAAQRPLCSAATHLTLHLREVLHTARQGCETSAHRHPQFQGLGFQTPTLPWQRQPKRTTLRSERM